MTSIERLNQILSEIVAYTTNVMVAKGEYSSSFAISDMVAKAKETLLQVKHDAGDIMCQRDIAQIALKSAEKKIEILREYQN
jgi:hypothetical protein